MKLPGQYKAEKERHRKSQALFDAIKKAREEGSAPWEDKILHRVDDLPPSGTPVVVKFGGVLVVGTFIDHDGLQVQTESRSRHIQASEILAVVEG